MNADIKGRILAHIMFEELEKIAAKGSNVLKSLVKKNIDAPAGKIITGLKPAQGLKPFRFKAPSAPKAPRATPGQFTPLEQRAKGFRPEMDFTDLKNASDDALLRNFENMNPTDFNYKKVQNELARRRNAVMRGPDRRPMQNIEEAAKARGKARSANTPSDILGEPLNTSELGRVMAADAAGPTKARKETLENLRNELKQDITETATPNVTPTGGTQDRAQQILDIDSKIQEQSLKVRNSEGLSTKELKDANDKLKALREQKRTLQSTPTTPSPPTRSATPKKPALPSETPSNTNPFAGGQNTPAATPPPPKSPAKSRAPDARLTGDGTLRADGTRNPAKNPVGSPTKVPKGPSSKSSFSGSGRRKTRSREAILDDIMDNRENPGRLKELQAELRAQEAGQRTFNPASTTPPPASGRPSTAPAATIPEGQPKPALPSETPSNANPFADNASSSAASSQFNIDTASPSKLRKEQKRLLNAGDSDGARNIQRKLDEKGLTGYMDDATQPLTRDGTLVDATGTRNPPKKQPVGSPTLKPGDPLKPPSSYKNVDELIADQSFALPDGVRTSIKDSGIVAGEAVKQMDPRTVNFLREKGVVVSADLDPRALSNYAKDTSNVRNLPSGKVMDATDPGKAETLKKLGLKREGTTVKHVESGKIVGDIGGDGLVLFDQKRISTEAALKGASSGNVTKLENGAVLKMDDLTAAAASKNSNLNHLKEVKQGKDTFLINANNGQVVGKKQGGNVVGVDRQEVAMLEQRFEDTQRRELLQSITPEGSNGLYTPEQIQKMGPEQKRLIPYTEGGTGVKTVDDFKMLEQRALDAERLFNEQAGARKLFGNSDESKKAYAELEKTKLDLREQYREARESLIAQYQETATKQMNGTLPDTNAREVEEALKYLQEREVGFFNTTPLKNNTKGYKLPETPGGILGDSAKIGLGVGAAGLGAYALLGGSGSGGSQQDPYAQYGQY